MVREIYESKTNERIRKDKIEFGNKKCFQNEIVIDDIQIKWHHLISYFSYRKENFQQKIISLHLEFLYSLIRGTRDGLLFPRRAPIFALDFNWSWVLRIGLFNNHVTFVWKFLKADAIEYQWNLGQQHNWSWNEKPKFSTWISRFEFR